MTKKNTYLDYLRFNIKKIEENAFKDTDGLYDRLMGYCDYILAREPNHSEVNRYRTYLLENKHRFVIIGESRSKSSRMKNTVSEHHLQTSSSSHEYIPHSKKGLSVSLMTVAVVLFLFSYVPIIPYS